MEENKHHYYYPLPGSYSCAAKTDQKNEREEASESVSNQYPISENINDSFQSRALLCVNKYALAGAILASTNSVLLGYGKQVLLILLLIPAKFPSYSQKDWSFEPT